MAVQRSRRASDDIQIAGVDLEYPDCPLCGCADARLLFVARDRLVGGPGEFPVVRCRDCGLVYLRPRPGRASLGRYYPDAYYPLDVDQETTEARDVARGLLRRVQGWCSERRVEHASLLDVGCGAGLFLKLARDAGFAAQGIELSQSAVDYARTVYGLSVVQGDLESAELPEASFDVVTMWHVLEHLPDPVAALRQVRAALKPGGLLLFGVPNVASVEARFFGRRWYSLDAPRHLSHFDPSTAERAVAAAGLTLERIVHSDGTAGMAYSIMGDLTGVSLRLRDREISERAYHRIARVLNLSVRPFCTVAARLKSGGAIEVYATRSG